MRQQAKPFTVEIKKSRKPNSEPQPLFGFLEEAAVRAPEAPAARLFERPREDGHNGNDGGHNGANHHADVQADIARVFGTAEAQRPQNRILPDLTAKPVVPDAEDEAPRERRSRIAKSKAPKLPKPKPLPVTLVERVVQDKPVAAPAATIRVRRRPKDEDGLNRAERWKRRLPRYAR
jgi:hypothetical protein